MFKKNIKNKKNIISVLETCLQGVPNDNSLAAISFNNERQIYYIVIIVPIIILDVLF